MVKILRQAWASLVEAAKILFINPDNLPFGERMRSVVKVLAVGASVVVGTLVSEAIGKTPLGAIPVAGDIVQTFCGTLVSGIMSCTFLFFFDRSEIMNKLVTVLNNLHTMSTDVNYFREQAAYFEKYAAQLMKIDLNQFKRETTLYSNAARRLDSVKNEQELNTILHDILGTLDIKLPWQGNFNDFMGNRNNTLVFE